MIQQSTFLHQSTDESTLHAPSPNSTASVRRRAERVLLLCRSVVGVGSVAAAPCDLGLTFDPHSSLVPSYSSSNDDGSVSHKKCDLERWRRACHAWHQRRGWRRRYHFAEDEIRAVGEQAAFVEDLVSIAHELGLVKKNFNVSRDSLVPEARRSPTLKLLSRTCSFIQRTSATYVFFFAVRGLA